jgi:hypothetical protein
MKIAVMCKVLQVSAIDSFSVYILGRLVCDGEILELLHFFDSHGFPFQKRVVLLVFNKGLRPRCPKTCKRKSRFQRNL